MTESMFLTDAARALHAERCRRSGIHDPDKIALYWEGCDQRYYERMVHDAATGKLSVQWAKEIVSRARGETGDAK